MAAKFFLIVVAALAAAVSAEDYEIYLDPAENIKLSWTFAGTGAEDEITFTVRIQLETLFCCNFASSIAFFHVPLQRFGGMIDGDVYCKFSRKWFITTRNGVKFGRTLKD